MIDTSKIIIITEKALKQIKKIKSENRIPDSVPLRVSVKGGGCSGLMYDMSFDEMKKEGDSVLNYDGLDVLIDGKSLFYLTGTVLDFSDGLNGKGFTFTNPNATRTCGCGESFSV